MKKSQNHQLYCVLVASALYALCGSLIHYNVLGLKSFGRSISLDTYTKLSPANKGEELLEDFLFIDIDEQSLSNLGQWPWPRKIFAEAISKILDAGPAVIGLDILLAERDRFNPISLEELAGDKGQGISQYFVDGDKALFEVPRRNLSCWPHPFQIK